MRINEKYKPLFINPPATRYYLMTGGRGSGKSFVVALFLLNLTYEKGHVILFTRWTLTSAYVSVIPEFIEKIELLNAEADFYITQNEITNKKTGSKIIFKGIQTSKGTATANLKSIQGVTTWVLEEAEELVDEDIFDKIDLSVRAMNHKNRVILLMNPTWKLHFIYKRFFAEKHNDTTYIHTTYLDNLENLSPSWIEAAERAKAANELRYNHIFLGHWSDEGEGLLWNNNIIEQQRSTKKTGIFKIVVAVDPATTKTLKSDETGVIVCAKSRNGQYYVLEDLSGRYSPNDWAEVVSSAVKRWRAHAIVAEKNQGGDMVKSVIRQKDTKTMVRLVQATKGKAVRAEPIYSLYEEGKVWHIGTFPVLEAQMKAFNPNQSTSSPDRVDALVWGISYLSRKRTSRTIGHR